MRGIIDRRFWRPVRDGDKYCSPGCGWGCTWDEYQIAKRRADALVKTLGVGWKARLWENLGWHYEAESECGNMTVTVYTTSVTAEWSSSDGRSTHQIFAEAKTPRMAVRKLVRKIQQRIAEYKESLEAINTYTRRTCS